VPKAFTTAANQAAKGVQRKEGDVVLAKHGDSLKLVMRVEGRKPTFLLVTPNWGKTFTETADRKDSRVKRLEGIAKSKGPLSRLLKRGVADNLEKAKKDVTQRAVVLSTATLASQQSMLAGVTELQKMSPRDATRFLKNAAKSIEAVMSLPNSANRSPSSEALFIIK
jgi:hypothetical protein